MFDSIIMDNAAQVQYERSEFVMSLFPWKGVLVCDSYLHGSSLMIAYEWRPPLNGDWLRKWHSTVRLISWEVLKTPGVGLLLPILHEQRKREYTHAAICRTMTWWNCLDVTDIPVVLPPQKRAWSQSQLVRSPPPQRLWPPGWSEALHGSVPQRSGPLGGTTEDQKILFRNFMYHLQHDT